MTHPRKSLGTPEAFDAKKMAGPAAPWSATNLPEVRASRGVMFSVIAGVVGLVAVVLAAAVATPISTTGAKMEPARFATPAQNRPPATLRSAATGSMVVPAVPPGK